MNQCKFGSSSLGLGDLLLLTSVCKFFPNKFTIQLPLEKEKYSILFDNIANVEITDDIYALPDIGDGHYSTRKLRNFFNEDAIYLDNRPLVLYSDVESEKWAFEYLKNKNNPIIFVPHCSKQWSSVRNMPEEIIKDRFDYLIQNEFTPILILNSDNKYQTNYEFQLENIDLKKYICLLRRVGIYLGCNTGDEHLATSVGCQTIVYQPKDGNGFYGNEWNYNHQNSKYFIW
jgi:ADP-heptose:LPS heptosyltransferase